MINKNVLSYICINSFVSLVLELLLVLTYYTSSTAFPQIAPIKNSANKMLTIPPVISKPHEPRSGNAHTNILYPMSPNIVYIKNIIPRISDNRKHSNEERKISNPFHAFLVFS